MNIIADTNIFLAVALNEPERERIIRLTSNATIIAPEILPYEIGNALSAMAKRGRLTENQARSALEATSAIAVRLLPIDVGAALRIALAEGIYAYDAYFLQCARMTAKPLLTLDRAMQQVASRLGLTVME